MAKTTYLNFIIMRTLRRSIQIEIKCVSRWRIMSAQNSGNNTRPREVNIEEPWKSWNIKKTPIGLCGIRHASCKHYMFIITL